MSYDPERITFFAKTDARGKNVPFGIKAKDRTRHVYVIGKTGMGKSTLLENMAVQDIKNGEGFAFIDPHGQTAETLLDYIPEERIKDVLYFAPHDMEFPVSFNIMEDVGPDKRHLVVSGLMSVFKKIWVDAWSARMEYILSNTLLALLEYPDSTLLGVNRMLSDKDYRKKVIDNISDPAVKSFWVDEFLKYNERYMQEAGDAIKNKIGQFTANPIIRNIVGQPKSSFDIRKIMDEKKILIMNLSKGLIGETNANLLGSMLTTRIYLAAMSRADLSPQQMQQMANFYFYVDEFQSFANATFANILSEARKYKLNLTIAHQYIEQMEEDVRNAVFGNVGTTIAFRVGPFDAEILETIFAPKFLAVDICNLGFAQVYLTLMIDGIGSSPFSAVTLEPIKHQGESFKQMLIAESRKQFGKPRAEVEQAIVDWHNTSHSHTPNNKKDDVAKPASNGNSPVVQNGNNTEAKTFTPRTNNSNGNNGAYKNNQSQNSAQKAEYKKPEVANKTAEPTVVPKVEVEKFVEPKASTPLPARENLEEVARPQRSNTATFERPRPQSNHVPVKDKPNKSLEDLRAVLKTIAKPEVKQSSSINNSDTNKEAKPSSDLRSVLAGIVTEAVKLPEEKKVEVKAEVEVSENPSEKQTEDKAPGVMTEVSVAEAKSQNNHIRPSDSINHKHDKLDPKHLERLMRVGVNDKTPLK
jgi:energy-coupling factor transporter ATP-binding protein EcfA2